MNNLRERYGKATPEERGRFLKNMTTLLSATDDGYVAWLEQENEKQEQEIAVLEAIKNAVLDGYALETVIARYRLHVANMQTAGIEDVYHSAMLAALIAYEAVKEAANG